MSEIIECTEFKYSELSDSAQQRAREKYLEHGLHDEWWDSVYEDAIRVAELLGVEIETTDMKLRGGGIRQDPKIYFSGFSSQGDGASFAGFYKAAPDIINAVTNYAPQDAELQTIARDLVLVQTTTMLMRGCQLRARVRTNSSGYCHSRTMDISVWSDSSDSDDDLDETPLADLIRRFADWIYAQLEAEHDYLTSDDAISEALADDLFDEDGDLL